MYPFQMALRASFQADSIIALHFIDQSEKHKAKSELRYKLGFLTYI